MDVSGVAGAINIGSGTMEEEEGRGGAEGPTIKAESEPRAERDLKVEDEAKGGGTYII